MQLSQPGLDTMKGKVAPRCASIPGVPRAPTLPQTEYTLRCLLSTFMTSLKNEKKTKKMEAREELKKYGTVGQWPCQLSGPYLAFELAKQVMPTIPDPSSEQTFCSCVRPTHPSINTIPLQAGHATRDPTSAYGLKFTAVGTSPSAHH